MKKILLSLFALTAFNAVRAQNINDALRYAQENLNGSARFRAMGGAFGAVGGDLSAVNQNPAGSAVFARSQVGVTLSLYNDRNKASYFGSKTTETNTAFDLNQAGAVFVLQNQRDNTGWRKFTLSVNYDNTNNYDNAYYMRGTNPTNSVGNYFLSYANQVGLSGNMYANSYFSDLSYRERQGFLGYDTYILDTANGDPSTNSFISNVAPGGNYMQDQYTETTGYNGKLTFNAGAAYNDRLYFGINLNTYFTDYTTTSNFYETNDNAPNTGRPTVYNINYTQQAHTFGNGFSLQLGAIAKVTPDLRIGLAYESPTWYELNDEVWQNVYTEGANYLNGSNNAESNSNITILYEPYRLKTPGKFTGSLAYVFGRSGLISIDYSMKDYGNTQFRPDDSYFNPINNSMANQLTWAGDLRIGTEWRVKNLSLRGGFRYEQSPYENGNTIGDLTSYSGGIGYQFPRTRIDLAYTYLQRENNNPLFAQGFTDTVNNKNLANNLSLGLIFEL